MKDVNALVLFSGGLDSVITVRLLQDQGINVTAFYINNGFRRADATMYLREISDKLGVELITADAQPSFFHMWKNPSFGYGKHVNPCVNCHALMANIAEDYREKKGFDFIATGDILEQRGFSQTSVQLKKVIKLIDAPEKILRPLSAKSLPKTEMEESMVDRSLLLDIKGKSRKIQYELLEKYGLLKTDVETPAGGCLLAEDSMAERLANQKIQSIDFNSFQLLKYGRHIEIPDVGKLILSKDKKEMDILLALPSSEQYVQVSTNKVKAPIGFIQMKREEALFWNVSGITKGLFKSRMQKVFDIMKSYTTFNNEEDKKDFTIFTVIGDEKTEVKL